MIWYPKIPYFQKLKYWLFRTNTAPQSDAVSYSDIRSEYGSSDNTNDLVAYFSRVLERRDMVNLLEEQEEQEEEETQEEDDREDPALAAKCH